jgi:hypothetical protein
MGGWYARQGEAVHANGAQEQESVVGVDGWVGVGGWSSRWLEKLTSKE